MSINSYLNGELPSDQTLLCKVNPGHFNICLKILDAINPAPSAIIEDSVIRYSLAIGTRQLSFHSDLSQWLGKGVNIAIDKHAIKSLKKMEGLEVIRVIYDRKKKCYIFDNYDMHFEFERVKYIPSDAEVVSLDDAKMITTADLEIDDAKHINRGRKRGSPVDLLMYGEVIGRVCFSKKHSLTFDVATAGELDKRKPDLHLRSESFLYIEKGMHRISVWKHRGSYWLIDEIEIGIDARIHTAEALVVISN